MYLIHNAAPEGTGIDRAPHGEHLAVGIAYTPDNLPVVEVEATNTAGVTVRVYLSAAQAYGAARVIEDQAGEAETQALAIEAGIAGSAAAARLVPCVSCGAPAGQPCQDDCGCPRPLILVPPDRQRRVMRLGDDSETPATGMIVAEDPDPEYVWVLWSGADPDTESVDPVREARDELMGR